MNSDTLRARLGHIEDLAVSLNLAIRRLKADLDAEPDDVVDSSSE